MSWLRDLVDVECVQCHERFAGSSRAKYCGRSRLISCVNCGCEFVQVCSRRLRKSCSQSCSAILRNREVFFKVCGSCGDVFRGGYQRLYCLELKNPCLCEVRSGFYY